MLKSCLADLKDLPETPLMEDFKQTIGTLRETLQPTFAETLGVTQPEGMGHQYHYQEQEHYQEQDQEPPPPPRDGDAAAFVFPCVDGATWSLGESLLAKLAEAYPGVDVRAQAKQVVAWCETNEAKRKPPEEMAAFFNAWLERNARRSDASPTPAPAEGRRTQAWKSEVPLGAVHPDREKVLELARKRRSEGGQ